MKVSPRACLHCGIPDKSMWPTECAYRSDYYGDPPCAIDEANAEAHARERRFGRNWLIVFVVAAAVLAAIYFS